MFDQSVHDRIAACSATFDRGTVYCDGGADFTHGLSEGSADCTCGYGRHYEYDGKYYPSLWDRPNEDAPADIEDGGQLRTTGTGQNLQS